MSELENVQGTTLRINDLEFTEYSSFTLLGRKYESLALYSSILSIIFMTIIWYYSGLFGKCKKNKGLVVIFVLGILCSASYRNFLLLQTFCSKMTE